MDELLTMREAQTILSVHRSTVQRLISKREIACVKVGGSTRIPRRSLQQYIERHTVPAAPHLR